MSATIQNNDRAVRHVLSNALKHLTAEQVQDFCELAMMYSSSRDPEVLETIVEMMVPHSLGKISFDAGVTKTAADQVDAFQVKIGDAIRSHRTKLGWTQEQLAQRAGLTQSHVCRLEQGTHSPTDLTIQKVANALGVDPSAIDPGW